MNITVYLGSTYGNDPDFKTKIIELGTWIAKNNHTLVFGGSKTGLMGELDRKSTRLNSSHVKRSRMPSSA